MSKVVGLALNARAWTAGMTALAILASSSLPAGAQVRKVDPNAAIDGDLSRNAELPAVDGQISGDPYAPVAEPAAQDRDLLPPDPYAQPYAAPVQQPAPYAAPASQPQAPSPPPVSSTQSATYQRDQVLGAAERAFGKGAEGLAKLIEDILHEQGEPSAYISGREAGGALAVGIRYGEGTLHHAVEGDKRVFWTGPSVGLDAGANAGSTFILVYNLWDSEDLYTRFPAGEGQAYAIGGFNASYVRKGDIVMIPVRLGVGVRLGVNAGYLRFSKKQRWLPF
ncbi:DUF1134 domain-containing protein [Croceicoccus sp. F390]|uniref:DUF1134 domain-containing protein n=1 Tax=Croceicoccus esteveae TaxID=3075597 RepID=A0ABU2ZFL2_9SPHN|nr:DUF1134 domain-containing protein [Croceicoccus sp. F390]MDT0575146.1 DUF1134 domain-containing protein [Croceicoccus sp. F390]